MQNPALKSYAEMAGLYGSALEYALRVQQLLNSATERLVREHIALVDSTVGTLGPVANAKEPKAAIEAQGQLAEAMRDQLNLASKNFLKIQEETNAEFKTLVQEGVEKFAAPLNAWAQQKAA